MPPAHVPWWRETQTDLHALLVHMAVETARHAGHLDILREQLDGGATRLFEACHRLPAVDAAWWPEGAGRELRAMADLRPCG